MMRGASLGALRERLLAEQERLRRLVDGMEAELSGLAGPRPVERTETAQQEGSLAVLTDLDEREWRALDEIAEALAKIRAGTYGVCEGCGSEIPLPRLHASPATRFCVTCQAERERGQRTERRATAGWRSAA